MLGALAALILNEGSTTTTTLIATDGDGDALTFSLVAPPAFASVSGTTLTLAPGYSNAGSYTLTVRVTDGKDNTDGTLAVTVTNVNQAPALAAIADLNLIAGTSAMVTLVGSDPDGDTVTYTATNLPAWATLAGSTITLAPPVGTVDTRSIVSTVSDGVLTAVRSFTLTVTAAVNQAPVLTALRQVDGANATVAAGATVAVTPILGGTVSDPESDTVKLEAEVRPLAAAFTNVPTHTAALGAAGQLLLNLGSLTSGTYKWQLRAVDSKGAASAFTPFNSANAAFTITQGAVSGSISVNANAPATATAAVTVTLSAMATAPASLSQMRFSNDGITFTAFEAYAGTKAWVLSGGDGNKTVTAEVRDSNNVTALFSDTITLDSAPPTISAFAINNAAAATSSTAATLSWTASDTGTGISKIEASNDGLTFTVLNASPVMWTLTAGQDGSRSVTLRATDAAGNFATSTDSISLDTTPPVPTSVVINNNNLFSKATAVTLTFVATDAASTVTHFCANETNVPPTSAGSACWTPLVGATGPFVLSAGDGTKSVYAWFKDAAGNFTVASVSDSIGLDQASPGIASMQLNGGSAYTQSLSVIVTSTVSDPAPGSGVTQRFFSTDAVTWSAPAGYSAMLPYTFAAGEGLRTLYLEVGDGAGNVSGPASASITVDTVAPTGTVIINAAAIYATTTSATVAITASDATSTVTKMCLFLTGGITAPASPVASDPCFTAFTTTAGVNLPGFTDGVKSVWVWFQDSAGNVSAVATDNIILDTNAPSTPPVPNVNALHRTLSLAWALSSDATSGTAGYEVGTSVTAGGPYVFGALALPNSISLIRSNGVTQYAVVRAVDNAGNKSPNSPEASGTPQYPFSHQYRQPTANHLHGSAFLTAGVINRYFIAGDNGVLASSDDGLATWTRRDPMSDRTLNALMVNSGVIWTAGALGHLSVSSDNGVVFTLLPTGVTQDLQALAFTGNSLFAGNYVAVGAAGTIVYGTYSAAGGSFASTPSGVTDALLAVTRCNGGANCSTGTVVIAAGANGTVLRSTDHGSTWTKIVNLPAGYVGLAGVTFRAVVNVPATETLYLGGTTPAGTAPLLRSVDGGLSWTAVTGFGGFNVQSLAAPNATDLWLSGDTTVSSAGLISRLVGATRTDQTLPASPNNVFTVSGLFARSSTELVALSFGGVVLKTLTGGPAWTESSSGTRAQLTRVAIPRGGVFNNTVWAAGGGGLIQRTLNGGVDWTAQGVGVIGAALSGISMVDVNGTAAGAQGYVVGTNGYIAYTVNGGTTWAVHADSAIVTNALYDVDCRSSTACIAVGANTTVLVSNGALPGAWTVATVAATAESYRGVATYLVGGSTPRAIIVGTGGSVRILNNTLWSNPAPVVGANFYDVAAKSDASGIAIAVGANGIIYKSLDHGMTWAAKPSGVTNGLSGVDHAAGTNTWYAAGFGVLLKSIDDGETWAPVITNFAQALNSVAVSSVNPNRLWAVGVNGSTLFSSSAGQ